ncbi:MAG: hypothetical protein JO269_05975 [Burkholderiaceae bacterium]|nr:hypothetical protein [Burkholderiaceae bacterium]
MKSAFDAGKTKISHKKTLFHTAAHFSGWTKSGQAILRRKYNNFLNETNDLAHRLHAPWKQNDVKNEGLSGDSEGGTSHIHMGLMGNGAFAFAIRIKKEKW